MGVLNLFKRKMSYSKYVSVLVGLFHSFRLLTGAISVLFFLKNGITIQELALLQIIFSTASLLLNYPTGILADYYSPKPLAILSCFSMALYYFICAFNQNLYPLIFAHFLQACGLSSMMGASSSWVAGWCSKEYQNNENYLNYLGHLVNEIESIGGIAAGLIGAALSFSFSKNGYKCVFFLTAILMLIILCLFAFIPSPPKDTCAKHALFAQTKEILRESVAKKGTVLFFLAIGLVAALNQPLFHFWQPFFQSLHIHFLGDENIIFGGCFAAFSVSKYLANRKLKLEALKNNNVNFFRIAIVLAFFTFFSFLSLSIKMNSLPASIMLFCILHGCLSAIPKIIHDQYIKKEGKVYIASRISLGEVLGRILSLCLLGFAYQYIDKIGINGIFSIASCMTLLLIFNLCAWEKCLFSKEQQL